MSLPKRFLPFFFDKFFLLKESNGRNENLQMLNSILAQSTKEGYVGQVHDN